MRSISLISCVLLFPIADVYAVDKASDEIVSLPGLTFRPNFKQYSGYLDASLGNRLHYWLVEATNEPKRAPLLLWLGGGGPGCSVLTSLLTATGPFRTEMGGTALIENVYSWNKVANVLYLDAPRDVGFSYRDSRTYGNDTEYNDDKTSSDTLLALRSFFAAFPEYQFRDFFLGGDAYAGVFVPTLSKRLISLIKNGRMNYVSLRGIAIGNGETSLLEQINASIDLLYYRGLIGRDEYTSLYACCPDASVDGLAFCKFTDLLEIDDFGLATPRHFDDPKLQKCALTVARLDHGVRYSGQSENTYQDCYNTNSSGRLTWTSSSHSFASSNSLPFANYEEPFFDQGSAMNSNSTDALSGFPCSMDSATEVYLRRNDVRKALHIPVHVRPFQRCNIEMKNRLYRQHHHDTSAVFDDILNSDLAPLRILLFNGDIAMTNNFVGTQWFVERLAARNNLAVTSPRAPWSYRREEDFAVRTAGYTKTFSFSNDKNIAMHLVTVKGAGQRVATDRPAPALQLIGNFLRRDESDFSRPLDVNIHPEPLLPEYRDPPRRVASRKDADKVYALPGLTFDVSFNHYSGYLAGALHYWLFESKASPSRDPLLLWLNTGIQPGCSALSSALTEHGPFRSNRDGKTLYENIYAWNKGANVLYIESPRGVGFSVVDKSTNSNDEWDDDQTVKDLLLAIRDFLDVFPEYIDRTFYIAGSGYGGVLVPALASALVDNITNGSLLAVNLRGVLVGNGLLTASGQLNGAIHNGYFRGLYGKEEYDSLQSCCPSANRSVPGWFEFCDFSQLVQFDLHGQASPRVPGDKCGELVVSLGQERVKNGGNDVINLYQDCYARPNKEEVRTAGAPFGFVDQAALISDESTDGLDALRCWSADALAVYLNLPEVRAALHVAENATRWTACSAENVVVKYQRQYNDSTVFFENVMKKKYRLRMLIYNGDVDLSANPLGVQWFIDGLTSRVGLKTSRGREPWKYLGAIAGYAKQFKQGTLSVDVVTVTGAGQFIAADRPGPALQMLSAFLHESSSYSIPSPYQSDLSPLKDEFVNDERASAGGRLPEVSKKTRRRSKRQAVPPPPPPGSRDADRIASLPGLSFNASFTQYSGYLSASQGNYLHYWLIEADEKAEEKPLILWLNGGPGCSSLKGLLQELGPFLVNRDGATLFENVFSWSKVGNLLFLESPRGVGFSYRASDAPPDHDYDDTKTASDNLAALSAFLSRFPEYSSRPLFLTGESYGGVYLPMLADLLIQNIQAGRLKADLQGVAIGNGIMSEMIQVNSAVSLAYFKGITGKEDYDKLKKCIPSDYTGTMAYYDWSSYIDFDIFDVYTPRSKNMTSPEYECGKQVIFQGKSTFRNGYQYNTYKACYASQQPTGPQNAYDGNSRAKRSVDRPLKANAFADEARRMTYYSTAANGGFDCFDGATPYLRRQEVRTALHIPDGVPAWSGCADLPYQQQYTNDTLPIFDRIISSGYPLRMLFYNGDTDMICQFLGDQWFTEKLARHRNLIAAERFPWMYQRDKKYAPTIAGYIQTFSQLNSEFSVDLLTVKGSGHIVPTDRPGPALQMIYNFVNRLPYNTSLATYSSMNIRRRDLLRQFQSETPKISRRDADRVYFLHGLIMAYPHAQYAGYLKASPGNSLFYWLQEAQIEPARAPLLLWLNGGPGCSSLTGLFEENGPFRPNPDGRTLFENVHSWNKLANVLYIDSPRSVGFSFQDKAINNDTEFSDTKVATDLALGLADFFSVFSEYAESDFFIAGESYAGVYVPVLADLLIKEIQVKKRSLRFKGIAIGNGAVSQLMRIRSNPSFLYFHGVFDKSEYESLRQCCPEGGEGSIGYVDCSFDRFFFGDKPEMNDTQFKKCKELVKKYSTSYSLLGDGSDFYNLYQDCYAQKKDDNFSPFVDDFLLTSVKQANRKTFFGKLENSFDPHSTDASGGFQCYMDSATEGYLSQSSVRQALHVPDIVQKFSLCNTNVEYHYHGEYKTTASLFQSILSSGYPLRVLFYNGDVDTACPLLEAQWMIEDELAAKLNLSKSARAPWIYRQSIGGYAQSYISANGRLTIDLLTVKGAGHLVPTDRPGPALQLIGNFLHGGASYSREITVDLRRQPLLKHFQDNGYEDSTDTSTDAMTSSTRLSSSAPSETSSSQKGVSRTSSSTPAVETIVPSTTTLVPTTTSSSVLYSSRVYPLVLVLTCLTSQLRSE